MRKMDFAGWTDGDLRAELHKRQSDRERKHDDAVRAVDLECTAEERCNVVLSELGRRHPGCCMDSDGRTPPPTRSAQVLPHDPAPVEMSRGIPMPDPLPWSPAMQADRYDLKYPPLRSRELLPPKPSEPVVGELFGPKTARAGMIVRDHGGDFGITDVSFEGFCYRDPHGVVGQMTWGAYRRLGSVARIVTLPAQQPSVSALEALARTCGHDPPPGVAWEDLPTGMPPADEFPVGRRRNKETP
jgi:hypothetical protein